MKEWTESTVPPAQKASEEMCLFQSSSVEFTTTSLTSYKLVFGIFIGRFPGKQTLRFRAGGLLGVEAIGIIHEREQGKLREKLNLNAVAP